MSRRGPVAALALALSLCPGPVPAAAAAPLTAPEPSLDGRVVERVVVIIGAVAGLDADDLAYRVHLADPGARTLSIGPSDEATSEHGGFVVRTDGGGTLTVRPVAGPLLVRSLPVPDLAPGVPPTLPVAEVLGDRSGVVAWRLGTMPLPPDEALLPSWEPPDAGAPAVAIDGAWWTLVQGAVTSATRRAPTAADRRALRALRATIERRHVQDARRVLDAGLGDVTRAARRDLVVAFRRPYRRTLLNRGSPRSAWVDRHGWSAHLALLRPGDLSAIWVAGTLARPVERLAACSGVIGVAYSALDDPAVTATSAWAWEGFAFLPMPELPGPGTPTCIDVDHDGRTEAVILDRS